MTRGIKRLTNVNQQKTIDRCEGIKMVADECLWSFHCTVLTEYSLADKLKPTNSVSKDGQQNEVFKGHPALFNMFNILVCPIDHTERQIIDQPPQCRLFPFVGSPVLPMNAFIMLADFIHFNCLIERAL